MSVLSKLTERPDVKQILADLNSKEIFKVPENRRQRRSLRQNGKHDVSEVYSPPTTPLILEEYAHLIPAWLWDPMWQGPILESQ